MSTAKASPKQHNLLLITTDQQRFDTINVAGCPWMRTPHLDWLCDQGIRFTRAYSDCPVCVPSRYSIMTGRHAFRQQTDFNPWNPSGFDRTRTLPALLSAAGYQTRAVGKMHFVPERDHLGFQHMELLPEYYREAARRGLHPMDSGLGQNEMAPAISTVHENDSLTRWIAQHSADFLDTRDTARPFFLWTSFSKPHPPFDPPMNYWQLYRDVAVPMPITGDWSREVESVPVGARRSSCVLNSVDHFSPDVLRDIRRAYYALITHVDYSLGHLFARLRELGLLETTTIIFTADHGDMLGDHHLGAKTVHLEGSAHVPLIVRPAPAFSTEDLGGTTCGTLACLTDLLPTFLSAAGLPVPTGIDGRDLLADRRAGTSRDFLVGEYGEVLAVDDGRHRYHWFGEGGDELLFDLQADPTESRDLIRAGTHREIQARLRAVLRDHLVATGNPLVVNGELAPRPSRALKRGEWPGFNTLTTANEVCH